MPVFLLTIVSLVGLLGGVLCWWSWKIDQDDEFRWPAVTLLVVGMASLCWMTASGLQSARVEREWVVNVSTQTISSDGGPYKQFVVLKDESGYTSLCLTELTGFVFPAVAERPVRVSRLATTYLGVSWMCGDKEKYRFEVVEVASPNGP